MNQRAPSSGNMPNSGSPGSREEHTGSKLFNHPANEPKADPQEGGKLGVRDRVDLFFCDLGPGLITGCADDDPSGISTYSIAGAGFGYGTLWTALLSFPLMVSVQMMCSRLGMVTGRGSRPLFVSITLAGFSGALACCWLLQMSLISRPILAAWENPLLWLRA